MILNYLRILFFAFGVLIPGLNGIYVYICMCIVCIQYDIAVCMYVIALCQPGSNYLESLEPVLWYSTDLEQYCLILDPLQTESISLTIICTLELLPTQDDMVNLQLLHNEVEIVQNTSKHSIRKSPYNARSNYKLSLDIVDFNEQDTGNYICRAVGFGQVRPPPTRSPQAMTAVLINSSATPCGLDHHSSSPTFRPKPPQVTQLSIFATLNNIRPASLDPTPTTCEPSTTSKQFSSTQVYSCRKNLKMLVANFMLCRVWYLLLPANMMLCIQVWL